MTRATEQPYGHTTWCVFYGTIHGIVYGVYHERHHENIVPYYTVDARGSFHGICYGACTMGPTMGNLMVDFPVEHAPMTYKYQGSIFYGLTHGRNFHAGIIGYHRLNSDMRHGAPPRSGGCHGMYHGTHHGLAWTHELYHGSFYGARFFP